MGSETLKAEAHKEAKILEVQKELEMTLEQSEKSV